VGLLNRLGIIMHTEIDPDGPADAERDGKQQYHHGKQQSYYRKDGHIPCQHTCPYPEGHKKCGIDPVTHKHGPEIKSRLRLEGLSADFTGRVHLAEFDGMVQGAFRKHISFMAFWTLTFYDAIYF